MNQVGRLQKITLQERRFTKKWKLLQKKINTAGLFLKIYMMYNNFSQVYIKIYMYEVISMDKCKKIILPPPAFDILCK